MSWSSQPPAGFIPRPPGMPPLPPGFKMPPGVAVPPAPAGTQPNAHPGGPQISQHHHYHHHHHHYHHQQQQQQQWPQSSSGIPPPTGYPTPSTRYPQPPPHLAPRSSNDSLEKGHVIPPGVLCMSKDVYAPMDDRPSVLSGGHDPRGYRKSTVASPYPQGPYEAPMEHDDDRRGGGYHQRMGGGRRDDELREPTNTVWVGNLDVHEHTEDVLRREFREFGRVIRIAKVPDKSYCFVHFRYVEEARSAVQILSARGTLGKARFNYGKMFEYSQEDVELGNDMSNQRPQRRGREEERHVIDDRSRRPRRDDERMEPTNVLWLGDLPPTVSNEELNENFKVFGTITTISRLDSRNMAFIHFETIESCTQALDLMRDQLIGGVRVTLNYGRAQRNPTPASGGLTADGIPANETPTNVVYLGQFASDVTEDDIEDLFEPFEGFINSKFIQSNGIAFGHFDTIEHARVARVALNNTILRGAPVRINFGKNNHSMTMADRIRRGKHTLLGSDGVSTLNAPLPAVDSVCGPLVGGPGVSSGDNSAMVSIPSMGVTVGAMTTPQTPAYFTRERPVPEMTLNARLHSLLGTTYNSCGEAEKSLSPSVIQTICDLIDDCVDEKTAKRLDDTIFLYTPLNAAHVFGILAKRMHDYFNDDPHKKLFILYAATRVLLAARTDYLYFTKTSLNAYLMTLFVASEGQTSSGIEVLISIIENLRRHPFIERQKLDSDFIGVFHQQLDDILKRVKVDQDLASLLLKKKRK